MAARLSMLDRAQRDADKQFNKDEAKAKRERYRESARQRKEEARQAKSKAKFDAAASRNYALASATKKNEEGAL